MSHYCTAITTSGAPCDKPAKRLAFDGTPDDWRCPKCFYREYLKSPHWQQLRARVLRTARHRCTRCAGTGILQVHHISYTRLGNEHEDDVVVLCRSCHNKEHQKGIR